MTPLSFLHQPNLSPNLGEGDLLSSRLTDWPADLLSNWLSPIYPQICQSEIPSSKIGLADLPSNWLSPIYLQISQSKIPPPQNGLVHLPSNWLSLIYHQISWSEIPTPPPGNQTGQFTLKSTKSDLPSIWAVRNTPKQIFWDNFSHICLTSCFASQRSFLRKTNKGFCWDLH